MVRAIPTVGLLGAVTLNSGNGGDEEESDFRQVPASDRGDESYGDRGQFGSYAPSNREPFESPREVRYFAGYGANEQDLDRGFIDPVIREDPAYDKSNYQERSTMPMEPDEDQGNRQVMERDWEFRNRNRQSRGFLTRPRIPTERG